jgi:uncharacterized surface protein with fasciclin (FAS1) repeats
MEDDARCDATPDGPGHCWNTGRLQQKSEGDSMKENFNIYEAATRDDKFSTFTKAIDATGLADTLIGGGPLTLFAPTDEAFGKLPRKTLDELMKPENKDRLTNILKYHLVQGRLVANDLKDLKAAKTLQGQDLKIDALGGTNIQVNNAKVITPAVSASNGVILPVDAVLMPQTAASAH